MQKIDLQENVCGELQKHMQIARHASQEDIDVMVLYLYCVYYIAYLGKLDSQCKKKRFATLQQHKKVIELLCFFTVEPVLRGHFWEKEKVDL